MVLWVRCGVNIYALTASAQSTNSEVYVLIFNFKLEHAMTKITSHVAFQEVPSELMNQN